MPTAADASGARVRACGARTAGWRRHVPLLKRVLFAAFLAAVAVLLWRFASTVDWPAVWRAARELPPGALAAAGGAVVLSYLVYSGYDLLGRRWVQHRIGTRATMAIAFVSYAFNLNFGSLIGGAGFRIRLYTARGLDAVQVSRVIGLSLATNWFGYLLIGGVLCATGMIVLPEDWGIAASAVRPVGFALLGAVAAYLIACVLYHDREWCVRGHRISLPTWPVALLQLVLSTANWLLIAAVMTLLLDGRVGYVDVLGVALCAAIAGAIAHIPAGLGVLEGVYLALLGGQVPAAQLLAVALVYRLLYYVLPLAVAVVVYVLLERTAPDGPPRAAAQRPC